MRRRGADNVGVQRECGKETFLSHVSCTQNVQKIKSQYSLFDLAERLDWVILKSNFSAVEDISCILDI